MVNVSHVARYTATIDSRNASATWRRRCLHGSSSPIDCRDWAAADTSLAVCHVADGAAGGECYRGGLGPVGGAATGTPQCAGAAGGWAPGGAVL